MSAGPAQTPPSLADATMSGVSGFNTLTGSADGEAGKKHGNETIRVAPAGQVSIRLPAPLAHLADAAHGRYVLTGVVTFANCSTEWADRVSLDKAVAYRIDFSPAKACWYLDASWQRTQAPAVPLEALRTGEVVGVDMNADHLAAWRLDAHGNPLGAPRIFGYQLDGTAQHRDAQVRHALTRLLHWTHRHDVHAVAVEDLDFTDSKTREKHGRHRRLRQLISGMPTAGLRARLLAMATRAGIAVIAVDPAHTSKWGAQHWHKPLTAAHPQTTRHHAAAVAIGRRALGHRIGDRRHRPDHTTAMWPGIGSPRPAPIPEAAGKPANPAPWHRHDPRHRPGRPTRTTRRPNTVRDRPPSKTQFRSVLRNGLSAPPGWPAATAAADLATQSPTAGHPAVASRVASPITGIRGDASPMGIGSIQAAPTRRRGPVWSFACGIAASRCPGPRSGDSPLNVSAQRGSIASITNFRLTMSSIASAASSGTCASALPDILAPRRWTGHRFYTGRRSAMRKSESSVNGRRSQVDSNRSGANPAVAASSRNWANS